MRAAGGRSASFSMVAFPLVASRAVNIDQLANREKRIDGEPKAHDIRGCKAIRDARTDEASDCCRNLPGLRGDVPHVSAGRRST